MDALIRRAWFPFTSLSLVDLAGRPLVARQVQWLHACGCDRVVIEVHPGEREMLRWIDANRHAFGPRLDAVETTRSEPIETTLRRTALAPRGPVLVVSARVLGDFDVARALAALGSGGAVVHAEAPRGGPRAFASGSVRVWLPGAEVPNVVVPGWCAELRAPREVGELGFAALSGALPARDETGHLAPIQIHAFEAEPGVWLARGAWVSPHARLVAPVLVGENAVVDHGAVVGPRVTLGERAAVESGAAVAGCSVPPSTIVAADGRWEAYGRGGSALRALLGA